MLPRRSERTARAGFLRPRRQQAAARRQLGGADLSRMSTLLISHSACLEHLTPLGHPERPDRLRAIERVLEHERFMPLAREQAPRATPETITLCHPLEYVEQIRDAVPPDGWCASTPTRRCRPAVSKRHRARSAARPSRSTR